MLEFVYRTLSRVLQMLLNGGEGPHSFGNTTVNIIYGKQKLAVDKEDLLVFEDGETKAGLMREPQILPRLNVYEVDVHQAVNIINKVSLHITINIMFKVFPLLFQSTAFVFCCYNLCLDC